MRQALNPAKTVLAVAAVSGLGLFAASSFAAKPAAPGSLDPTFGVKGVATVDPGDSVRYRGSGVAPTPNGGVVQGLMSEAPGKVVKYTNRGRRDRAFGTRGVATLRFGNRVLSARDVIVGSEGRVLVAGEGQSKNGTWRIGLASLKLNGKPNRNFADGGLALPKKLQHMTPTEMAFAPGGKIVVVGYPGGMPSARTVVARFLSSGRLDRSFSKDGLVTFGVARNQIGRAVAVDRRGRVVVGSPGGRSYNHVLHVARFLPDGRPDRSFGKNGTRTVNAARKASDDITDIAVDRQGRIVVAGGDEYKGSVARLRSGGALDRTFGRRGVLELPWFVPNSLDFDRRGRLIAIGDFSSGESNEGGVVRRFSQRGKEDMKFHAWITRVGNFSDGFIDRKGRVVAGGTRDHETPAVARLITRKTG